MLFEGLMRARIIAQLLHTCTRERRARSSTSERLQWHERQMTSAAESPHIPGIRTGLPKWLMALGVSLATALLVVSPFFWLGTASGHDIAFHASSWLDAAGQWKEGIVYPRWSEWANHGFGEPRFIFYPPLSWMLGAMLGFVLPWNAVPGVFIILVQTMGGVSMFALLQRFFSPGAALFGAACYAANPYTLLVVYMRSDFAEQLACVFLPLLLLAALQLSELIENRWNSSSRAMAIFAMLFAAVWLSNAPAGVLASYSLALLFAWAAVVEKSVRPLWRGAGGLTVGFGLTSFYLLPAAYEQGWVNISQALSSGLQPSENFLFTEIADPEHNLFNWIASGVAVLLIVVTGIAALLAHRNIKNEDDRETKEKIWRVMLLLSTAAIILMLHPSSILWTLLPKLRFLQFPWRWMGVLALAYAYFGAAAIARRLGARVWGMVAAVVLATGGTAVFLVHQAWWDTDDIPVLQEGISKGEGFDGTDEYDPAGDDHYNLPQKAPQLQILPEASAPKVEIRIARWTAEERDLSVTSLRPVRLAVRLLNYPAWRVEVNGQPVSPGSAKTTTQMILHLSAGPQRIWIKFAATPDRKLGGALSGGAGAIFLVLLILKRSTGSSLNE